MFNTTRGHMLVVCAYIIILYYYIMCAFKEGDHSCMNRVCLLPIHLSALPSYIKLENINVMYAHGPAAERYNKTKLNPCRRATGISSCAARTHKRGPFLRYNTWYKILYSTYIFHVVVVLSAFNIWRLNTVHLYYYTRSAYIEYIISY